MRHSCKYYSLALLLLSQLSMATTHPVMLEVKNKTIMVDGKSASVYTIEQPDGTWGYVGTEGQDFNVIVKNDTKVATGIHWHGLILPNAMDGVPDVTQPPILPGAQYRYRFKLVQAGTFWMHSHMGLQTQQLMEAPLIINDPNDPYKNNQQVVVMFQDFNFQSPEAALKSLQSGAMKMPMKMDMNKPDLNDVTYDAFLTNYHTLQNPQVVKVQPGTRVRLRFIDGGSGSNFWIHLGQLSGTAIAFDGENIKPLTAPAFQLAMGQRIDILVQIPKAGGAFPILGQVEGTNRQTGLILVTPGAAIPKLSETTAQTAPALNNDQELAMKSLHPLPAKPIDKVVNVVLTGNMQKYIWMINDQAWPKVTPIQLKQGQRVELIFDNRSNMGHPMHLHGSVYELVGINQQVITDGPLHDTIFVLPHTQVKVIFDADHLGKWMLHCHMAYHQESGMMTVVDVTGA